MRCCWTDNRPCYAGRQLADKLCSLLVVCCSVHSNNLTDLPEDLSGLQHVRTLRIKYNQLSRVPAAVMRLPQLNTLELSGNQIVKLDSAVAKVSTYTD